MKKSENFVDIISGSSLDGGDERREGIIHRSMASWYYIHHAFMHADISEEEREEKLDELISMWNSPAEPNQSVTASSAYLLRHEAPLK